MLFKCPIVIGIPSVQYLLTYFFLKDNNRFEFNKLNIRTLNSFKYKFIKHILIDSL